MHKGIIAYVLAIIVVIVLWYAYQKFASPFTGKGIATTTIQSHTADAANTTTNATVNTTLHGFSISCDKVSFDTQYYNSTITGSCHWSGGLLGLRAGRGSSSMVRVYTIGADGIYYINQTITGDCSSIYAYKYFPAQNYSFGIVIGAKNTSGSALCNETTVNLMSGAPSSIGGTIYQDVPNGNFATGSYYMWNITGKAFQSMPLNLTLANNISCHPGNAKWSGYNGTFFASTYNCSKKSQAYGNLTSSVFNASEPFLNFQTIGYGGPFSYIEILQNGKPTVRASFNTYNISNGQQQTFTLRNATIPLMKVYGKPVQIRVVANETAETDFIVVGDFRLDNMPVQEQGVLVNITT